MIARVLPSSEWERLDETNLKDVWRSWTPEDTRVFVSERDGHIVDHWVAVRFWHLEGLHIASGSFRPLWRVMADTMHALGALIAWTGAEIGDTRVHQMLEKRGGQLVPIDHFVLPITAPSRKENICHS